MTQPHYLALDQGTTSTRAMFFTAAGETSALAQREIDLICPQNGWVEQDVTQIWERTLECLKNVAARTNDIRAIGITNQRETTILWNKKTGIPVYNAIVWQDRRTADHCKSLREQGWNDKIAEKTGLLLDPYFSATKIAWILGNVEGVRAGAERGDILFGTVDSFLIWKLTGGKVHATDVTNASRTMLFNIRDGVWDDELLALFNIPRSILPEVKDCADDYGATAPEIVGGSWPIRGVAGDQQAALIGQACTKAGMIKATYGTGCFALMNIGPEFRRSSNKLLTSIGYKIGNEKSYVLEGSIFVAGAAIQFLRDNLKFFDRASGSEELALSVPSTNGVYFVPAFTGLGAPYWNPDARGAILGLTRDTSIAHITRAALEAQAYQTRDLFDAFIKDSGIPSSSLRVDGGLVENHFMVQFLSNVLGITIDVPKCTETTALGAAYLAAIGCGDFASLSEVSRNWAAGTQYTPEKDRNTYNDLYEGWKQSVIKVMT